MTVAKIRILNGHVTLFPWKIINVKENLTIQGLFEHIVDQYVPQLKEEILEKIEVRCSEAKEQTGDEVELGCVISDIVSIFDLRCCIYRKKFIRELSNALWYVDKCESKTFNSKYTIPAEFSQFVDRFDPVKDKKGRPLFTYDELNFHNQNLTAYLKMSWIEHPCFTFLKPSLIKFANDLQKYAEYLLKKAAQTKKNHDSMKHIVNEEDASKLKIILPVMFRNPTIVTKYKELVTAVESTDYWKIINVDQYCPNNSTAKSTYLQNLEEAFTFKIGIYTYHHGNVMNMSFVWKIDPNIDESAAFKKNYEIRNELKSFMPVYATRAMRREFVNTCDMFLGNVEKSRVRRIYKEFTGDSTADESEIDARVKLAFDLKDPELITDL
ncbi:hypothetical protein RclHR1_04280017 [Rhizophagus clarus]|uniref:Uncharacterized protein n=1 Tax=Rhizophagus clarus TaxID=94130 RepID=A0A2Z6RXJ2_9GLOM|nr:hypothetical protein RclHR1_04280017 [Rhizophagus clarus]